MEDIKLHYEGDNLHIEIPKGMTDEHGKLLIEHIEEELQSWGITEVNEINNDSDKVGLWVDAGNRNMYVWDASITQRLKDEQTAVLEPQGKLSDYVDVSKEKHKEFLVWYYGEPLEEAIKEMEEDCKSEK